MGYSYIVIYFLPISVYLNKQQRWRYIMLYKLKYMLYKLNIITKLTTNDMLDILKSKNIDIYKLPNNNIKFNSYTVDIVSSIELYRLILDKDINNEYIQELIITSTRHVSLLMWCSDNAEILHDPVLTLKEWLEVVTLMVNLHKLGINSLGSGKLYSNSLKLTPHIHSINNILKVVLKNI